MASGLQNTLAESLWVILCGFPVGLGFSLEGRAGGLGMLPFLPDDALCFPSIVLPSPRLLASQQGEASLWEMGGGRDPQRTQDYHEADPALLSAGGAAPLPPLQEGGLRGRRVLPVNGHGRAAHGPGVRLCLHLQILLPGSGEVGRGRWGETVAFRGGSEYPTPQVGRVPHRPRRFAASSSSLVLVQGTGLGPHPLTAVGSRGVALSVSLDTSEADSSPGSIVRDGGARISIWAVRLAAPSHGDPRASAPEIRGAAETRTLQAPQSPAPCAPQVVLQGSPILCLVIWATTHERWRVAYRVTSAPHKGGPRPRSHPVICSPRPSGHKAGPETWPWSQRPCHLPRPGKGGRAPKFSKGKVVQ